MINHNVKTSNATEILRILEEDTPDGRWESQDIKKWASTVCQCIDCGALPARPSSLLSLFRSSQSNVWRLLLDNNSGSAQAWADVSDAAEYALNSIFRSLCLMQRERERERV